jgi:biotin transport system substrate-specific component
VQPSAGYAWGFLLGALVVGLLTRLILPKYPLWLGILVTAVGGMVAIYAVGIPWMALATHTTLWAATTANFLYFPGDAIKVLATAVIAKQVHRAYPGLIPLPRRRSARGSSAIAVSRDA